MRRTFASYLLVILALALASAAIYGAIAHTARAQTSQQGYGPNAQMGDTMHMGAVHWAPRRAWWGYYDGHIDVYYNTDASDRTQARMMGVNFAPSLRNVSMTPAIYLVEGRAVSNQLAVFGSEPGESDYSPLWHEVIVRWKASAKPVLLVRDDQINDLAKKGQLTATTMMHTILNCPIIHVGKGGS